MTDVHKRPSPMPMSNRGVRQGQRAVEEARTAGLLEGEKDHVTFRAPRALVEAARRNTGADRPTELGLIALAMAAQTDPFADFLLKTRGILGPDHDLEF